MAYPTFIFGAQRSGTDMVGSVISRCANVEFYNESDSEAFHSFQLRSEETVTRLVRQSRAVVVLFKCILDSQSSRKLLGLHESAKAIWLFRPYADVVNSNLKKFKGHFQDLTDMVHDPSSAGWRVENVAPDDLELVKKFQQKKVSDASARALLWFLRNQLLFQQNLENDPRVLVANYDHLVTDPIYCFARIFDFLGLAFSPNFVRTVRASSIGKDAGPVIDDEIASLCQEMFDRLSRSSAL